MESAAVCRHCGRALCDDCFRRVVDDAPWCDACVDALSRDRQARMAMGGSVVLVAWGLLLYASRLGPIAPDSGSVVLFGGIAAMGLGLSIGWPRRSEHRVRDREPGERFESVGPASPYRARLRRVARAAVTPLSARNTVLAVAISMVVAAVLLPVKLKLPHWLESELVLGAWWAVLTVTLAVLLHRGSGLADDYHYRFPHLPAAFDAASKKKRGKGKRRHKRGKRRHEGSEHAWLEILNPLEWLQTGEAFVVVAVVAVVLLAALVVAWFLVEALLPLVFLVVYYLLRRALTRAAADTHDCHRRPARSLLWGAIWSAIYVAPLGLLVWGVHAVLRWKHGG